MGNLNKVTIPLQNRREGTLCQCPAEPWGSRGRNPAGRLPALRRHRLPAPRAVAGRGKAALTTRTGGGAPVPPVPCGHRPSPARPGPPRPLWGTGNCAPRRLGWAAPRLASLSAAHRPASSRHFPSRPIRGWRNMSDSSCGQ